MEKFKLKVQKHIEEEREITLPHYRKGSCHAYKIISQDKCIQITYGITNVAIQIAHAGLAFNSEKDVECTKEEFEVIYGEVYAQLSKLIFQV